MHTHAHTVFYLNSKNSTEDVLLQSNQLIDHQEHHFDGLNYPQVKPYLSSEELASIIATSQHEDINLRSKVLSNMLTHSLTSCNRFLLSPSSLLFSSSIFPSLSTTHTCSGKWHKLLNSATNIPFILSSMPCDVMAGTAYTDISYLTTRGSFYSLSCQRLASYMGEVTGEWVMY